MSASRYLVKSNIRLKTEEVLSKWEVLKPGQGPRPTIGNFAKIVYYDLERPDVITDLQEKIGILWYLHTAGGISRSFESDRLFTAHVLFLFIEDDCHRSYYYYLSHDARKPVFVVSYQV